MVFVGEGISKKFATYLVDYYYGLCIDPITKKTLPYKPSLIRPVKSKCFIQVYDEKDIIRYVFVDEG